ncbi:MAG: dihydrolipoyl dehydrogenase, partial [Clostridia bacterium]|nr:dihydrolipoyl dehydrogenase [Clostridia bacterium]
VISHLYDEDEFGFSLDESSIKLNYEKAYERSRKVSEKLVRGTEFLMKKNDITLIKDEAVFNSNNSIRLKGTGKVLSAGNIIIAAGSRPMHIEGIDFSKDRVLDSKKALQLKAAPKSVVIIGGGAIGMEFASIWNSYGADITIVEMMPEILPNEDEDISKEARKQYERKGIRIFTETKVTNVEMQDKKTCVTLTGKDGRKILNCEYVLVAAGIIPNSDMIGIEKTDVELDSKGYIKTDDSMCTNVKGVYAIGDITGKFALAHAASAEGIIAANAIAGNEIEPMNYQNIPKCTYGFPETASAGLTESQARGKGIDVVTGKFPFSANGKAAAYGAAEGFVKIVAGKKYGEILGIHMIGTHVTEMISSAVGYMSLECTLDEISKIIHPHPTISEAILEAAHAAEGQPIHI